jgi:hypothetical protein
MKKNYFLLITLFICSSLTQVGAQVSFKNKNAKLINPAFHSGCTVAIADWNFDGLDDIIRLDDGRMANIEVQRTNATFQNLYVGAYSSSSGWWPI